MAIFFGWLPIELGWLANFNALVASPSWDRLSLLLDDDRFPYKGDDL